MKVNTLVQADFHGYRTTTYEGPFATQKSDLNFRLPELPHPSPAFRNRHPGNLPGLRRAWNRQGHNQATGSRRSPASFAICRWSRYEQGHTVLMTVLLLCDDNVWRPCNRRPATTEAGTVLQRKKPACAGFSAGRSGVIRTLDPHVPNVVRYQTALHSVTSGASIDRPISLRKHQNSKAGAFFRA